MECASASELPEVKKKPKKGIIYLSSLPPYFNVSKTREVFSEYGTLGRVFLQLNTKDKELKKKKSKRKSPKQFTEGWVEFDRKSVAKKVASLLNNTQVSSRKKSKQYDCTWNIKYLRNFKWTHLNERLAYERAARKQKLRAEVQLAKKKSNYFTLNLNKKKNKSNKDGVLPNTSNKESGVSKVEKIEEIVENRENFLKSLFD